MSFVFYGTKTTGDSTAFDQILRFCAIKTNYELVEIDRFETRCRLLPYVVPSPRVICATGITVEQLTDPTLPSHYQMMCAVRAKLLEWSPAVFVSHNSLGFHEHLLRQAFYKTLHAPYLTNTNRNCRTDSLRMVQTVAQFAPNVLSVPIDDQGRSLFKLDRLAPANGFDFCAARDEAADVEATVHMCRLMSERVPDYWSGFLRFAQKAAATDFALEEDVFALTEFYSGGPYSWMVTGLGVNPDNGSEVLVFDLSIDPEKLASLPEDALIARFAKRSKPVRVMRANAGPIVFSIEDAPEDLRAAARELDELKRRASRIKSDLRLSERLIAAFIQTRRPREPSPYVEEQIYDDFASNDDQAVMERFHKLEWRYRTPMLGRLADRRLQLLGKRLIYEEAPDLISESARRDYDTAVANRLMADDASVPWLTFPKAIEDANGLISIAGSNDNSLLADLRDYLSWRAHEATALLA